jgi:hypothetical protein
MREGNRSEAIRQYVLYRTILHRELGIEPTTGLTEMLGWQPPADTDQTRA